MTRTKKRWLVASLVAVLVLAVAAVAVAQETGSTIPPAGPGQAFLDNLAKILGIDRAKLDQAFKDAASQTIDQGVAEGWIPKDVAPSLKQRIQSAPFWGPMMGFGRGWGGGFWGCPHWGYWNNQNGQSVQPSYLTY